MSLTPTEREEHFFKAMVDAADGNTPEELEPTERKEHWYKEIIDAIKSGGGSGGERFIVTLTPTALDLSGTADKTLNEVYSAYEAGMEIVAHIPFNGAVIEAKLVQVIQGAYFLPTFYWMAIDPSRNMQILAYNSTNADDPNPTPFSYSTKLYTLTPAT